MTEGTPPAPREGAASCVVTDQRQMVVFAGKGVRQRYNDLFYLDLDSFKWSQARNRLARCGFFF